MEKIKKSLAILNLTGEFSSELSEYFNSRKIHVVDPLKSEEQDDWTHIITKDIHDFDLINKTYNLIENERSIISLSKVDDLQNFTMNNGNIILDDIWFKGLMGPFILDKYFQGYGGISLGDNYPSFQEHGSFNVANPFNTGEYLDRMVHKAFESGIEALTLKTYFDHLVMYLAGLKKKGKAGLPFEVTYGSFEDIFAIQVHFFSQDLQILDVASGLSSTIKKKAEEYFLNVAVQSADFFDFSFMPDVNKVIVTGLWTKDERIKYENRGLMFMSLLNGTALAQYDGGGDSQIISSSPLEDFSDKIIIPDSLEEDDYSVTVKGGAEQNEDEVKVIKGGSEPSEDEVKLIKGEKELDELVQTIKGKYEEDKSSVRISGNKLDVDKAAFRIAASIDDSTKEGNLKVRQLGNQLPAQIKTGLFDFAKGLNKPVEDLDDSDLSDFQSSEIPRMIKEELSKDMAVKSLAGSKIDKGNVPNEAMKALEAKYLKSNAENEKYKTQLKALTAEVRILKESRLKMAEIQLKATLAAEEVEVKPADQQDEVLRQQFQEKLQSQKTLNEQDLKKLAALLEREAKHIHDLRQEEGKSKKLQIEAIQKETYFTKELENSERQIKSKDLILIKTKETFTKLLEKKENEIIDLRSKADQLTKALTNGPSQSQGQQIKDLERSNQNLTKQLEVYKVKISSLASNISSSKSDDGSKDELRKQQMINQQMKNQIEAAKKEIEKIQTRASADSSLLASLKQDKVKLDNLLKKATTEVTKEVTPQNSPNDQELKRLQAQTQILETQLKDSSLKISNLEAKLAEANKPQKVVAQDDSSKIKVHLEANIKKLTQDLVESRNQLNEMKKETNKLRQDKTALQNQLDKLKKEADKGKPALPKKPGSKAA